MIEKEIRVPTADGEMTVFTVFPETPTSATSRPSAIVLLNSLRVREWGAN